MGPQWKVSCYKCECLDPHGKNGGADNNNRSLTCQLQLENGFAIWDFRGQELTKQIQDRFKQFIWRPRPLSLLSKERQKQIRKNLRDFSRTFDEDDAAEESNVSAELTASRKRLVDEWNAWRSLRRKEIGETTQSSSGKEEAKEEIELWIDEVIEQIEEEVEDTVAT